MLNNKHKGFTIFILFLHIIIFQSFEVYSQQDQFNFEHITIQQGLNDNQVYCIGQDKKGFMWFGTPSGLNRFDGYRIKVYSHIPQYGKSPIFEDDHGSLWMICEGGQIYRLNLATEKFTSYPSVGQSTYQLYKDNGGEIWAATKGNGLAEYIQATDSFITYTNKFDDTTSISSDTVNVAFEDSRNNIWVGTSNGLNLFDTYKKRFKRWDYGRKLCIKSITEDKNGIIWLGTIKDGVFQIDKSLRIIRHYNKPATVYFIYVDSNNNLWLETNLGVSCFDRASSKFLQCKNYLKYPNYGGTSQNPILEDDNGKIWSIAQRRIAVFAPKINDFAFIHFDPLNSNSINDNIFNQIFKDDRGNLWFGTNTGGINYISNARKQFTYFPKKLVTSLYMDKTGILWVGTQDGIFKVVKNHGRIFYKKIEKINNIICQMTDDNSGHLWIAAYNSLICLDKKSEKINWRFSNGNVISHVLVDKKGKIWIGNWDWLLKYNPNNKTFSKINLTPKGNSPNVVSFLYEDNFSNIWVSGGKLMVIDENSLKPKGDIKRPYLKNNDFSSVYEDSNKKMWFLTYDNKIYLLNKINDSLENFTPKSGIKNEKIIRIVSENKKALWLLTSTGIAKYDLLTGSIKNYSEADGAITPSTGYPYLAYCQGNKGEIYFGGNDGYVMFYPDSIKNNTYIPPVVLTSFKIFNREVKLDTAITEKKIIHLNYSENNISFEFSALNYTNPQKNQYAYKLEGFDKEWTYCGTKRNVSYTNINSGNYIFKVKGANNDGVWNETGTSISIIISPPLWATTWAYILYVLFFVFTLYSIRRFEVKKVEAKNKAKVEEEVLKREETDKLKSRFFANISHEFRTPLTLISGPIEKIISKSSDKDILKDAGIVKKNAIRLLQLVNQLLDLSKLEGGKLKLEASKSNIVSFVKSLLLSFESWSEGKDITLKVESEKEYIEVFFDKEKMNKIFSNILSNAFKFTPQNGKIMVSIIDNSSPNLSVSSSVNLPHKYSNGFVELKIRDTGIGIPKEEIPRLFDRFYQVDSSFTKEYEGTGIGLALTKELIELHHGSISVESERENPDNGGTSWTEIAIRLPLGKDHLKEEEIVSENLSRLSARDTEKLEKSEVRIDGDRHLIPDNVDNSTMKEEVDSLKKDKTIILIVEDNYDMREYIKESLEEDYLIEEAVNGEQGLRRAENIIPDLIICDMMMPKLDGNEMTKILKNDERTSHIPVIILTAKSGQESKLEGLLTGADDYLTKPFDIRELKIRIDNLIKTRKKLQEKYGKGEPVHIGGEKKLRKIDLQFLDKVLKIIDEHISNEDFSIEDFSCEIGMSRTQLHRKLKALAGKSASQYLRSVRLVKAKKMIEEEKGNISEIAYSVGFSSPAYFSRCFKEEFGYPPSELVI